MRTTSGKRLNKRVQLWIRDTTISDYGEHSESFNVTATRWASVEVVSGREFAANVGDTSEQQVRFRFRYDSVTAALTTADRLKFDSKIYDIKSVIDFDLRNKDVVITAVQNDRQR